MATATENPCSEAAMASLLMCPPDFYGIRYEINPWMRTSRDADPARARVQWDRLRETLTRRAGATVELIDPADGWPDMVFTANAGLVTGRRSTLPFGPPSAVSSGPNGELTAEGSSRPQGTFVSANFRHEQRSGEAELFARWFADRDYNLLTLPGDCKFEGEGDVLWSGERLMAGYHFRSDLESHRRLGELLGCEVISLELTDRRFYHLDTCLAPLDERSAVIYRPAFDDYARRALDGAFEELIELESGEALRFAANAVIVGRSVVLNSGCPKLVGELGERGYEVFEVELDEFMKAGGAAKCLVLFLER